LVGEPRDAVAAAQACAEHGVWVGCFRPPSVPDGVSRLRLTARANLDDSELAQTVQALAAAAAAINLQEGEESP
jgi:8-amino-7-oxononanoate synthase